MNIMGLDNMDSVIFVVTLPIYFEKRMRNSRSAIDFVLDMSTLSSFNTLHFKGAVRPISVNCLTNC